jgi:hypothetical protein
MWSPRNRGDRYTLLALQSATDFVIGGYVVTRLWYAMIRLQHADSLPFYLLIALGHTSKDRVMLCLAG